MNARSWPLALLCLVLAQCDREAPASTSAGPTFDPAHQQPPPAAQSSVPEPEPASLAGLELRLSVDGGTVAAAGDGEPVLLTVALRKVDPLSSPTDRALVAKLQNRGLLRIDELANGAVRACPLPVESLPAGEAGVAFAITLARAKVARDLTLVAVCEAGGENLTSNPIQLSFAPAAWQSESPGPGAGLARLVQYRIARGELDEARTALVKLAAIPAKHELALGLAAALFAADGKSTSAQEAERMLLLAVAERAAKREPPCDHQLELPLLPPRQVTSETSSDPLLSQLSSR